MKKKIFTALAVCFLMLTLFSAFISEINAQPKGSDNGRSKPNDRAKKLAAQGDQFFNQKEYRSAINKYAEAIVISPNYPAAHYWKGYAHYYLNEYDAAIEDLDLAYNQGYTKLEVYKVRWYVNFQKQNYDAALNDAQQGLRLEPANANFISALGDIYLSKEDYPKARQFFEEAGTLVEKALDLRGEDALVVAPRLVAFDVRQAEFDQPAAGTLGQGIGGDAGEKAFHQHAAHVIAGQRDRTRTTYQLGTRTQDGDGGAFRRIR